MLEPFSVEASSLLLAQQSYRFWLGRLTNQSAVSSLQQEFLNPKLAEL